MRRVYPQGTLTDFGFGCLLAFVFVFVRPSLDTARDPMYLYQASEGTTMPSVELDEATVQRLDDLRVEDESYDELVTELINIYEAEELTLFHGGDEY